MQVQQVEAFVFQAPEPPQQGGTGLEPCDRGPAAEPLISTGPSCSRTDFVRARVRQVTSVSRVPDG